MGFSFSLFPPPPFPPFLLLLSLSPLPPPTNHSLQQNAPKITKQHNHPPLCGILRDPRALFSLDVCTRCVVFGGCCLWLVGWLSWWLVYWSVLGGWFGRWLGERAREGKGGGEGERGRREGGGGGNGKGREAL